MNSKTRLRLSYVLPSTEHGSVGHRLGVTGLAYDAHRSTLYSGGRDGVICSWDASLVAEGDRHNGQVPAIKQIQAHSNWINSIELACSGQAVISASSDASVKLWKPDAFDHKPNTIGTHSDYVKCVASPGETQTWAASGGLDHHIITWDLTSAQEQTRFKVSEEGTEKGSIYALAASDNLVVSGGTETAIKLWDTRSSKRVSRLVGHTDIVRSILVSKNQDRIITASSDRTIKIWSVAAGRCLSSLAIHSDSVWSLHSDQPDLQTFHSADKSGLVAKTEISGLPDSDQSLSFALCQEHNGVSKVLSANGMVWTATSSSSINCWQDVRGATEARVPNTTTDSSGVTRNRERSITVKRQHDSDLTALATKLPASCLLRVSNTPGYLASTISTRVRGHGQRPSNVRKASLVSREPVTHATVPARDAALSFTEGQTGFIKHIVLNDRRHVLTLDTSGAIAKWDILRVQSYGKRDLHEVAETINTKDVIPNFCTVDTKSGTLNCTLTENQCLEAEVYADELEQARGHTFAPDHRVNLGKWVLRYLFQDWILEEERRDDDFRKSIGREYSSFNDSDRPTGLRKLEQPSATDSFTVTIPRLIDRSAPSTITGIGAVTPSRNGDDQSDDIKLNNANEGDAGIGALKMSTSNPQRRSGEEYVSRLSLDHEDEASSDSSQKLPMTPTERSDNDRSTTSSEMGQGNQGGVAGPSFGKRLRDTFSPRKISRSAKPQDTSKAIIMTEDKQDNESTKAKMLDGEENSVDDRVSGLIHQVRRGYLQQLKDGHDNVESAINAYSTQEAPPLQIASRTRILIQEEHSHAATVTNLFEGYHGELAARASLIESVCPMWLGRVLLRSHTLPSDTNRISFFLKPHDDVLPDISGDKSEGRLTASRHTRARKTLEYVVARLQPANKMQAGSPLEPESFLELYCQNQPVPLNMTLASVRTHLWKTGGDIILHYKSTGKGDFTASVKQKQESEDRKSAASPT